jgi:pimeloyl-ACP methyl ester carboxylesterase
VSAVETRSTPRDVAVAGLQVHLEQAGDGPPLLLLHHSTGPLWTPFLSELAASFTVTAPDLPGFGRSERPDWARHPRDEAILLLHLLDELALERVDLAGLGFGGWIAAELATMSPQRLSRLVLVGAAGLQPREGEIHDPFLGGFEDFVRLGFSTPAAYAEVFGETASPELLELWDFSREMTARLTWKPWMFSHELPHLLCTVRVPALLVWGELDAIVPLDAGRRYAELLPEARLEVVPGAGHNVDLERPDALAALVRDFLS